MIQLHDGQGLVNDRAIVPKKQINCKIVESILSFTCSICAYFDPSLTIKTSNSSKHLKGTSIASHKAIIKHIFENDLSPVVKLFCFFVSFSMLTWNNKHHCILFYVNENVYFNIFRVKLRFLFRTRCVNHLGEEGGRKKL